MSFNAYSFFVGVTLSCFSISLLGVLFPDKILDSLPGLGFLSFITALILKPVEGKDEGYIHMPDGKIWEFKEVKKKESVVKE